MFASPYITQNRNCSNGSSITYTLFTKDRGYQAIKHVASETSVKAYKSVSVNKVNIRLDSFMKVWTVYPVT